MRQFCVIGLGRFGSSVVRPLAEKGYQVLGIDSDESKVQDMVDVASQSVCLDATDEKALRAVGTEQVDVAIVAVGSIEASILITLVLKEIGIEEVIVKAISEEHRKVLQRLGATKVILPERDMGIRLANSLISPKVIEQIDLGEDSSIAEVLPPKEFVGRSLRELNLRSTYGLNVIGIKKRIEVRTRDGVKKVLEEKMNFSPNPDDPVREDDILVVVGKNQDIEKLKKQK